MLRSAWTRSVVGPLLVSIGLLVLGAPGTAHAAAVWTGQVATDELNVRAAPRTSASIVGVRRAGEAIRVVDWVEGEIVTGTNNTWAVLGPGQYVYSSQLAKSKPAAPPSPPANAPSSGRWIDLNLTEQVITAYEGNRPVNWALTSTGRPGWETPTGVFSIQRRVFNETMDSGTLAVAAGDPYRLDGVLHTQYFTPWGHALHYNYWKWDSPFGVPTSHGCAGLTLPDSTFLWNFATVGTPLIVHH